MVLTGATATLCPCQLRHSNIHNRSSLATLFQLPRFPNCHFVLQLLNKIAFFGTIVDHFHFFTKLLNNILFSPQFKFYDALSNPGASSLSYTLWGSSRTAAKENWVLVANLGPSSNLSKKSQSLTLN